MKAEYSVIRGLVSQVNTETADDFMFLYLNDSAYYYLRQGLSVHDGTIAVERVEFLTTGCGV